MLVVLNSRKKLAIGMVSMAAFAAIAANVPLNVAGAAIDTSSRAAVVASYNAEFTKTLPAFNWNGAGDPTCDPGTISNASREALITRVNWYRQMAGIPEVTEGAGLTTDAQAAALMMSVNNALDHGPTFPPGWKCYSTSGKDGAGASNLFLRSGYDAMDGYIEDPGASNNRVGHRHNMLNPPMGTIGVGSVPAGAHGSDANALSVLANAFGDWTGITRDGYVAWPPKGFVPGQVVYPRWSFRRADDFFLPVETDYSNATVTVNGVAAPIVWRPGPADNFWTSLVWEPTGINTAPAVDTTYTVAINNVLVNDGAGNFNAQNFTYDVIILGTAPATAPALTLLAAPCALHNGALAVDTPQTVQVTGACGVPADASAGVFTVSAISPQGPGNLRLSAAEVAPAGGVVNYIANGLNNSNTVTVPLSATGAVDVTANAAPTSVRLVVIGYYSAAGTLKYFPLTPCAVADSRTGDNPAAAPFAGPFAAGANYPDIDVVGTFTGNQGGGNTDCQVPTGADGVVVNVVAVNGTGGSGGLAVGPGGTEPTENTTNFVPIGFNNSAVAYVPVDANGKIAVNITTLSGTPSTHVRLVVLGYLDTTGGEDFTSVNPCAAFDTRTLANDPNPPVGAFAGKRVAGNATTYNMTGAIPADQGGEVACNVPEGVSAVLVNLVAIQPDAVGNFRAYATNSTPTGGVLNFAAVNPPVNNSNAVVVPVDGNGNMDLFVFAPANTGNQIVHARGVILGYYN